MIVSRRGGYDLQRTDTQSGYKHVSKVGQKWRVDYKGKKSKETFHNPADAAHLLAQYLKAMELGGDTDGTVDDVVESYLEIDGGPGDEPALEDELL